MYYVDGWVAFQLPDGAQLEISPATFPTLNTLPVAATDTRRGTHLNTFISSILRERSLTVVARTYIFKATHFKWDA
jgi:hypothetical protein